LEGGDILGVDLHPEHNHEAIENKDEDEDKISDISKSAPDVDDRHQVVKAITSTLGISWFNETSFLDILLNVGEIVGKGNGGCLVGEADSVA